LGGGAVKTRARERCHEQRRQEDRNDGRANHVDSHPIIASCSPKPKFNGFYRLAQIGGRSWGEPLALCEECRSRNGS
jgi:hypothetical protein